MTPPAGCPGAPEPGSRAAAGRALWLHGCFRDIPTDPVLQRGIPKGSLNIYIFNIYNNNYYIFIYTPPPGASFPEFQVSAPRVSPAVKLETCRAAPAPTRNQDVSFSVFQFFTPYPRLPENLESCTRVLPPWPPVLPDFQFFSFPDFQFSAPLPLPPRKTGILVS